MCKDSQRAAFLPHRVRLPSPTQCWAHVHCTPSVPYCYATATDTSKISSEPISHSHSWVRDHICFWYCLVCSYFDQCVALCFRSSDAIVMISVQFCLRICSAHLTTQAVMVVWTVGLPVVFHYQIINMVIVIFCWLILLIDYLDNSVCIVHVE